MNTESQINAALRRIGSAEPPLGLERRVIARLEEPVRGFTAVHSISAIAIAAGLAVAVLAFGPLTAKMGWPPVRSAHSARGISRQGSLRSRLGGSSAVGAAAAEGRSGESRPGTRSARTVLLPAGSRHAAGTAVRGSGARTLVLGHPLRGASAAIPAASFATAARQ